MGSIPELDRSVLKLRDGWGWDITCETRSLIYRKKTFIYIFNPLVLFSKFRNKISVVSHTDLTCVG